LALKLISESNVMNKIYLKCGFALALLNAFSVAAHDVALLPAPDGKLIVRYGHPGDWLPTDKERLLEVNMLQSGLPPAKLVPKLIKKDLELITESKAASSEGPAMAASRYDNGLWVTTVGADGKDVWHNSSKAMMPGSKNALLSLKFAKGLFGSSTDTTMFQRPVGHILELIPLKNPVIVKPSETIDVMVKFKGKPLANAEVELTDDNVTTTVGQAKYKTNSLGIATVPVRLAGLNVLSVDYKHPNNAILGKDFQSLPVKDVMMVATYAFRI
jgi:nickel transport protein